MVLAALHSPLFVQRLCDQDHAGKDLYDEIRVKRRWVRSVAEEVTGRVRDLRSRHRSTL
ncbi:hypothetical protein ABT124_01810 [Streptomyces sp. NPDC001982]|uniref:hypothetical protein n=1 Tax=Streptomyces sp. NPDC001982 TaxID=3154405 RepID=UPI0033223CF5